MIYLNFRQPNYVGHDSLIKNPVKYPNEGRLFWYVTIQFHFQKLKYLFTTYIKHSSCAIGSRWDPRADVGGGTGAHVKGSDQDY